MYVETLLTVRIQQRIGVDSKDSTVYWRKLKQRLKEEGNETVTNCHGLKMRAADGKMRESKLGRSIISNAKASDYLLPESSEEEKED